MITPTQIQTQFAADFGGVSTATIQIYIAQAYAFMNADVWAEKLDFGATYLACHWMVVDGVTLNVGASTLGVGPVASQTLGPASQSFAVAPNGGKGINDLTDLGLSRYGLVYQRMKRGLLKTPLIDVAGIYLNGRGGVNG